MHPDSLRSRRVPIDRIDELARRSGSMRHRMRTDYPDLVIAKRLLDHLKALGFQFPCAAVGEDGPLVVTE